ncbi:MAG: hypothetical protein R2816_00065 [Flavobacteriaceae bacterium]|nr:hypothetical protein [Flavobacteriaceae bacterium]
MSAQNSRAKILVNAFEKQIEVANKALDQNFFKTAEGKIGALERSLESIKQKDPDFDISNLEKQLSDLKIRCGATKDKTLTTRANDKEHYYNNIKISDKLDVITRTKSLSNEDASELLALDISTIDMSRYQRVVEEFSEMTLSRDLPNLKSLIDETPIVQEVLIHYNRFSDQKRYWQTVSKLMPNSDIIKNTYLKYEAVDKELGGEAGVKSKAKAQYGEYLKNKTMPKAVTHDATAEAIIKKAYEDEGRRQGYNRTLIKINLLENDWTILTKKYTGVIVGRKRAAAIAFKDNKTGECSMYRFFEVYQQYNGSGYSNDEGTSTTQELIPCENIK